MIWLIYLTAYPRFRISFGSGFLFLGRSILLRLKRSTLACRDHTDSADLRSITRRTDLAQELCYARQRPKEHDGLDVGDILDFAELYEISNAKTRH